MSDRDIIDAQIEYYRRRAPDYDDWWNSRDGYDFGPEVRASFEREIAAVRGWADTIDIRGDVLELAAGTGIWTGYLAGRADSITAVDASPETLEINRSRLADASIGYVVADLFEWIPDRQYDTVFFSFWLTHVPDPHFAGFWSKVKAASKQNGLVVVIDNAHPHHSMVFGPGVRQSEIMHRSGVSWDLKNHTSRRRLRSGDYYTIVKRFWQPDELSEALGPLGWDSSFANTGWAFLYGTATPRRVG